MRAHPLFNIAGFHDHVQTLVLSLESASDLAHRLDHPLEHVLHRILDRVPDLPPDLDYSLDRNLPQASNYALLSTHDLAHYLVRVRVRVRALVRDLDRVQSFAGELARTIQALVHFHHVLSDVTGVDLRSIDLAGIPLQGLRWSVQTQWPPEVKDQIWRDSMQIADGIFEVGRGDTTYAQTNIYR